MKTIFIRAIEASIDEKAEVLRAGLSTQTSARYEVDIAAFQRVPKSPFAYWASDATRNCFSEYPAFESNGRTAKVGLQTSDDFRFVRLATEISPATARTKWFPLVKGGKFSRYYSDVYLVVEWAENGRNIHEYPKSVVRNQSFFFQPGLTWPLRGTLFSAQFVPEGCIFSVAGKMAFSEPDELPWLGTLFNSSAFDAFIAFFAGKIGGVQYEVGLINSVPVPNPSAADKNLLSSLGIRAWAIRRYLDSQNETSHAFSLPALARHSPSEHLDFRANLWFDSARNLTAEISIIEKSVNEICFNLYGISETDLRSLSDFEQSSEHEPDDEPAEGEDDSRPDESERNLEPIVAALLSWTAGVGFGRFDVRLALGEPADTPEPAPFDPLPICSTGTLTGDDGLPATTVPLGYPIAFPADGILVDDPGHARDLVLAIRSVFDVIFEDADARWHEAMELLGTTDLRLWFARDFFEPHIKRYSKSQRKAPIYWQLATASGSYSVWLYVHRATNDTLYRVLNDFVGPKLDHERSKLDRLTQEYGQNPSSAQRKEIADQEEFVNELQAFKSEVARVAPLWKPNLDDGVILNYALLWRLVPQSRSWQLECKSAWDKLQSGAYDWAHIAMHLWPERVVLKCADDRSLAIAHGLEDVFWRQDEAETWRKNKLDDETLAALIHERSSTTVKSALRDLLSAPTPAGGKAKPRSTAKRSTASAPKTASTRAPKTDIPVNENILQTIKNAIVTFPEGASKADVLSATDLSDGEWNKAIATLLERGEVARSGQGRGTRYGVLTGVE